MMFHGRSRSVAQAWQQWLRISSTELKVRFESRSAPTTSDHTEMVPSKTDTL